MSNEPIDEHGFLFGVTVVDIGDLRVARGLTRRPITVCRHAKLSYDQQERRIWCRDCETDVDPFDAFRVLVEHYSGALSGLFERDQKLAEAEQFQIKSLAAKEIDKAWRSRSMLPACPSCGAGLFPESFKGGASMIGRNYAEARRNRAQAEPKP